MSEHLREAAWPVLLCYCMSQCGDLLHPGSGSALDSRISIKFSSQSDASGTGHMYR